MKPTIIACNKADVPGALDNYEMMENELLKTENCESETLRNEILTYGNMKNGNIKNINENEHKNNGTIKDIKNKKMKI